MVRGLQIEGPEAVRCSVSLKETFVVASDVHVGGSEFHFALSITDLSDGEEGVVCECWEDVCRASRLWESREVDGTRVC
jgi:hypothetical protein